MSGVGYLTQEAPPEAPVLRVPVVPLDEALEGADRPALLAADVEGAELAVLRGARRMLGRARPVIAIEACGRHLQRAGASLEELHVELLRQGYLVRAIRRWGLRPPDLGAAAEPGNWVAVPEERKALLGRLSLHLKCCGALPPWRGVNPLAK